MEEITIIVDTREPEVGSWDCYFQTPTVRAGLKTGDFSVMRHETEIAIERKTLDDLIGCLSKGRDRFEGERERSMSLKYFAVLVEAGYGQLVHGDYRSLMKPRAAVESISAFEIRYGTHFLFAGNQELAALKCESLLLKYHREQTKKAEMEIRQICNRWE